MTQASCQDKHSSTPSTHPHEKKPTTTAINWYSGTSVASIGNRNASIILFCLGFLVSVKLLICQRRETIKIQNTEWKLWAELPLFKRVCTKQCIIRVGQNVHLKRETLVYTLRYFAVISTWHGSDAKAFSWHAYSPASIIVMVWTILIDWCIDCFKSSKP